jgi:hypothetical protein
LIPADGNPGGTGQFFNFGYHTECFLAESFLRRSNAGDKFQVKFSIRR